MVLALILVMAKNGTWVLEQPFSSLVFRHPRFQQLLKYTTVPWLYLDRCCRETNNMIFRFTIPAQVYRQAFWMAGWGGCTPKRTVLWSNSTGIRWFATTQKYGRMKKRMGSKKQKKLADVYFDSRGQKRYKGNSNLKTSQWMSQMYAIYMNSTNHRSIIHYKSKQPCQF